MKPNRFFNVNYHHHVHIFDAEKSGCKKKLGNLASKRSNGGKTHPNVLGEFISLLAFRL